MVKKEDLTCGTLVQLSPDLKYSRENRWASTTMKNCGVKYGTITKFHYSIKDAIEIQYRYRNKTEYTFLHYKDLIIIDKIPTVKDKSVLFDEHNLDI